MERAAERFCDVRLIIADDGSEDDSLRWIRHFQRTATRSGGRPGALARPAGRRTRWPCPTSEIGSGAQRTGLLPDVLLFTAAEPVGILELQGERDRT
ncbi:MAG: hypothetical protein ACLFVU_06065 [Phycisphaerae bacterium]